MAQTSLLSLVDAFLGTPSSPPLSLPFPSTSLILYASADTIVLLDTPSLSVVRILSFSEAFPGSSGTIACITVDKSAKLIAAGVDSRLAVWAAAASDGSLWRIHSTLLGSEPIQCIALQSGRMTLGTNSGMSMYDLDLKGDLPIWRRLWSASIPLPKTISLSPSFLYIASASPEESAVRIHSISSHHQIQIIQHPRPVVTVKWRQPLSKNSEEACLYTTTSDSVLRIFAPVIDAPNRLQLQASLDRWSFLPHNFDSADDDLMPSKKPAPIFALDRDALCKSLVPLGVVNSPISALDQGRRRKLEELKEEDWELFAYVANDGSLLVRALTNLDRRPPTLLRQFTFLQLPARTLQPSPHLLILPPTTHPGSFPTLLTSPPLRSHELHLLPFVDGAPDALLRVARGARPVDLEHVRLQSFVRTPDGGAIASIRHDGGGEIYVRDKSGRIRATGSWDGVGVGQIVLFDRGRSLAVYAGGTLRVHLFTPGTVKPSLTMCIVHTPPSIPHLLATPLSSSMTSIISITTVSISTFTLERGPLGPTLELHSVSALPLPSPPSLILPVEPMAWAHQPLQHPPDLISSPIASPSKHRYNSSNTTQDTLVSVSDQGHLSFWIPEASSTQGWMCTGSIHTGQNGIRLARCSSAKKTAIVSTEDERERLTIWDSKESEFASGLEYSHEFDDVINDLDWTSTDSDDAQSILAVGFNHRIVLLCQQRMTYFDQEAAWAILGEVDLVRYTPLPISDSIWFAGGALVIGAGHQMFHFGNPYPSSPSTEGSPSVRPSDKLTLFERVARQNGPLEDYHPQNLLQCLLWGKIELVKDVIVRLAKTLDDAADLDRGYFRWTPLPVSEYTKDRGVISSSGPARANYSYLFDESSGEDLSSNEIFGRALVSSLVRRLEETPLTHLTVNERAHLIVLIQTTLQIEEQRRSLDENGLRYLISLRLFYIINERQTTEQKSNGTNVSAETLGVRHRIRYRDIVWAFFSQSQEILLSASTEACGGRMEWKDARALVVSRHWSYTHSESSGRDHRSKSVYGWRLIGILPNPCLLYFALGKVRLVHGLWKQAAWHPEQKLMLKFLSNDFDDPRWRTAALKNAYALLSKQRFEYAAAFFLLGRSLKDAVSVCVKQLKDFQVAVALARIVENGDDGPVLKELLLNTVVPTAFKDGNRWLACWAFWKLHRRDLSVRILLTPLSDIAALLNDPIEEIGNPHYDDPSLALLFRQLKSKSLQTVKGSTEISGRTEFNFVLQIVRVFCRMGCHALALDLVMHWSFDQSSNAKASSQSPHEDSAAGKSPPPPARSPVFGIQARRQSFLVIDMEIPSLPATRPPSPDLRLSGPMGSSSSVRPAALSAARESEETEEIDMAKADVQAKRTGLGNLMQSAKKDVQVAEFDINTFF
ncbi:hypothetical protein BS47DRAFT_1392270 [Hydnum rufescens UP504]|uniref:RAVE complex protein Rav1 C-terminal domain-containing protein n=1 Tax=Hydnum rufescens UP504 TaxID=1448309 RepID=A0A9P6AZI6_9AGAM|nr:hypothetical protein BS47DRAFT_1392270 [Hydnum rufescens UP504]